MFFAPFEGKTRGSIMSIVTQSSVMEARSKTPSTGRRYVAVGMLGTGLLFSGVSLVEAAPLPQHPCTPELQKVLADWDAVGFETPSKPSQATVYSRSGRVSSGPEVRYMASEIHQAIWDCQNGDVPSVRAHVANVNVKLNPQS
jgi:hypothetical protein